MTVCVCVGNGSGRLLKNLWSGVVKVFRYLEPFYCPVSYLCPRSIFFCWFCFGPCRCFHCKSFSHCSYKHKPLFGARTCQKMSANNKDYLYFTDVKKKSFVFASFKHLYLKAFQDNWLYIVSLNECQNI